MISLDLWMNRILNDKRLFSLGCNWNILIYSKEVTKSITDPECGLLKRPEKPTGFHYLDHQTCDAKNGLITDVFVTPGNNHDSTPHTARLEYQIDKFDLKTEAVCADGSYDSREVYNEMLKKIIKTLIPQREKSKCKSKHSEEYASEKFRYDAERDIYICPEGKILNYRIYLKNRGYKRYSAKDTDCLNCPHRKECIGDADHGRRIERHLHEAVREIQTENIDSPEYCKALKLRKIWCEGNFSHQKENHNLRRTRKRGIERVTEQCLLSACALNLKRMVKLLKGRLLQTIYSMFFSPEDFRAVFFKDLLAFVNSTIYATP